MEFRIALKSKNIIFGRWLTEDWLAVVIALVLIFLILPFIPLRW